ncbi:unnamed protein product [Tuber melanosporum]|uniref:(Perigord truffle) hypothetical protein n=1 Tax=Tuber melanosporum (strain Mel28) TaxID=656061 RepID=D5GQ84_TUBMM|nr:uncharacterized protein GSTUM_00012255001 [Tuber melanosporum]CAZ86677.1 unnamed protein product [Tuber melanosporum]
MKTFSSDAWPESPGFPCIPTSRHDNTSVRLLEYDMPRPFQMPSCVPPSPSSPSHTHSRTVIIVFLRRDFSLVRVLEYWYCTGIRRMQCAAV